MELRVSAHQSREQNCGQTPRMRSGCVLLNGDAALRKAAPALRQRRTVA